MVADLIDQIRPACAELAPSARHVRLRLEAIEPYARTLPLDAPAPEPDPEVHLIDGPREELIAFWLTLEAVNFGSGWFPTLRKRPGRSGYQTIASGIRRRFSLQGRWSAAELEAIEPPALAELLEQDAQHELMAQFARALRDLGAHVAQEHGGRFDGVVDSAGTSAVHLASLLGSWDCFADSASYGRLTIPFLKRAQLAAADLARTGLAQFEDLDRLTMFADNLVPHVLRLDGVLTFEPGLIDRIERGELIEHGSAEEVEIRACALHAVELLVAARPGSSAAQVDQILWHRGHEPRYKARPRHRCRCTAY